VTQLLLLLLSLSSLLLEVYPPLLLLDTVFQWLKIDMVGILATGLLIVTIVVAASLAFVAWYIASNASSVILTLMLAFSACLFVLGLLSLLQLNVDLVLRLLGPCGH